MGPVSSGFFLLPPRGGSVGQAPQASLSPQATFVGGKSWGVRSGEWPPPQGSGRSEEGMGGGREGGRAW